MQRVTTIAVGVSFLVAVALLGTLARAPAHKRDATAASAQPQPQPESAQADVVSAPAAASGDPLQDVPVLPANSAAGFDILPDGTKAPPLPDTAPQAVRFGVIQFAYSGAQFAGTDARSKEQAHKRAQAIIEEAKKDFAAAAAKGDRGSTADAGRIQRGILEPAAEYILFTLGKGEVGAQPVETPRGYWVLRRND